MIEPRTHAEAIDEIQLLREENQKLRDENLRLYRELTRCEPVSAEMCRLQKLMEGHAIPGKPILDQACDYIELLQRDLDGWPTSVAAPAMGGAWGAPSLIPGTIR